MSILLELFNKTVPWEKLLDLRNTFTAQFVIDELTYIISLDGKWTSNIELDNPYEFFDDVWEIHFAVTGDDHFSSDKITGTGNAIRVFSTVMEIIGHTVDSKNIQSLTFAADNEEPTRVKLYDRLATYFSNNGWRYISDKELTARSESSYDDGGLGSSYYLLTTQPPPAMNA